MKQSASNTLSSHDKAGVQPRPQARPAPTGPGLRLTAMPRPNLPFNGLHLRNPCKLHGSLLIYRPRRDGRLSWPSWLTQSGRLTDEVVTRQPWTRRRSGKVCQLQTDVLTTEPRRQPRSDLSCRNRVVVDDDDDCCALKSRLQLLLQVRSFSCPTAH